MSSAGEPSNLSGAERLQLEARIEELAHQPVLLVASDFDGTLAPIVNEPAQAEANRESLVALRTLSKMSQTHVAIISGRSLADLAHKTPESENVHLIGSHGSEFEVGFTQPLSADLDKLLQRLFTHVEQLAATAPHSWVEKKPAGLAYHYRNVETQRATTAVEAILSGPARWPGVFVRQGKCVIELSVVETNKGQALRKIRQLVGASAVCFLGDDVTDEDAFVTLSGPDLGVKVGEGVTQAAFRAHDSFEVARILAHLTEKRSAWLAGASAVPIEQHALLSDQRTIALVDPRGRVVWMCLPRIDSAAVFAELLGGSTAGFFEIADADGQPPIARQYLPDTFILRTDWPGFTVTDYLDCSGGRAYQRAGRTDLVRVIEGRGPVRITFAPRLNFSRLESRLVAKANGLVVEGGADSLVLYSPGIRWQLDEAGKHQTAWTVVELSSDPLVLEMRYGTGNLQANQVPELRRREQTIRHWQGWAASMTLPPVHADLVKRSALVLRALTYGPTGALAAAATTSLPESMGGVRNWDYRFCWPRDAALSYTALARLGVTGPGIKFLDWLLGILNDRDTNSWLYPVYTVGGSHLGTEAEIPELAGYRGSRPVRIGNAAAQQVQLDVFGPIAELIAVLADRGAPLSAEHWELITRLTRYTAQRWMEADHGIWEIRSARQHHVHSKVMCWQTLDRALQVARYLGQPIGEWPALADAIAQDVLQQGWNSERQSFMGTYEHSGLDAATLCLGLSGIIAPNDPRWISTVRQIEKHLRAGGTVFRYLHEDGLPGREGGFLLCTSWLIEAYQLIGEYEAADELLSQYVQQAQPLGLFPEEFDPNLQQGLGNYPQAYSHVGLINAALRLSSKTS
ncbi:MAG: hypothetical protein HJJLKODD_00059 [Phycisphaerae bacterium]|nr:hypothetical protein [Phycisphaerae bacterium]